MTGAGVSSGDPKLLCHGKHTVHRKTHPTLSLGASLDLAPGPSAHARTLSRVIQGSAIPEQYSQVDVPICSFKKVRLSGETALLFRRPPHLLGNIQAPM